MSFSRPSSGLALSAPGDWCRAIIPGQVIAPRKQLDQGSLPQLGNGGQVPIAPLENNITVQPRHIRHVRRKMPQSDIQQPFLLPQY